MQGLEITAETRQLGPVRLFATGREGVSSRMGWRKLEPLEEQQLFPKVIVIVGKLDHHLSMVPSWSVLLEMYALKGIFYQLKYGLVTSDLLPIGSATVQSGVAKLRETKGHAACEANFSRLKKWLQCCRHYHIICSLEHIKPLIRPSPMPKRLIDLGIPDISHATLRIIDTRGRQEHYVALSYC
jgi:hypothetical protein